MPWLNCKICTDRFYAKPRHIRIGWGKYCSNKCKFKAQKSGRVVKCANCGRNVYRTTIEIFKSKSGLFFCNKSCHAIWANKNTRTGKNNPNWVSGISAYRKILIKDSMELKCKECGFSDHRVLVVHHKDGDRNNNELSNLILLCRNCHYLKHESRGNRGGFSSTG